MTSTHKNFKSLVKHVEVADDISEYVGIALHHQHSYSRRTTPWEMALWDQDELHAFTIDIIEIDRVYAISNSEDVSGNEFHLIARIEHKNQLLFVELTARCNYTGFDCYGGGMIFITTNPNLFAKVLSIQNQTESARIYKSLRDDGYYIEDPTEFDRITSNLWQNPPTLKYLCHLHIYDNRQILPFYKQILPQTLVESVNDFIQTQESIYDYDNWESD